MKRIAVTCLQTVEVKTRVMSELRLVEKRLMMENGFSIISVFEDTQ